MSRASFLEFVLEQFQTLGGVRSRPMFGGHGLYRDETFFAIVHRGTLYFRTDPDSREEYLARGMQPFRPNPKQTLQRYYEVPSEVLEDPETLAQWARRALRSR